MLFRLGIGDQLGSGGESFRGLPIAQPDQQDLGPLGPDRRRGESTPLHCCLRRLDTGQLSRFGLFQQALGPVIVTRSDSGPGLVEQRPHLRVLGLQPSQAFQGLFVAQCDLGETCRPLLGRDLLFQDDKVRYLAPAR